jgi:hypothetical protein
VTEDRFRDYVESYLRNWREYDAPLGEKLRLAGKNRWRAISNLKGCCGNHSEPGC